MARELKQKYYPKSMFTVGELKTYLQDLPEDLTISVFLYPTKGLGRREEPELSVYDLTSVVDCGDCLAMDISDTGI